MTEPLAASVHRSRVRRSLFMRSLAIVVTAAAIGPVVGALVVLLVPVATIGVRPGTVLAEILQFGGKFIDYLGMSYFVGLLPALCFGILFCIAAFVFRWNSSWAAVVVSLPASVANPLMIVSIARE